jgi:hypothetical protein
MDWKYWTPIMLNLVSLYQAAVQIKLTKQAMPQTKKRSQSYWPVWILLLPIIGVWIPYVVPLIASGNSTVSLFLQFSDAKTIPKEIRQTNVPHWHALPLPSLSIDGTDSNHKTTPILSFPQSWAIYLMFEEPISYRQIIPTCVGAAGLKCVVEYSNSRYAIVMVNGDSTGATLEVSMIR